MDDNRPSWLTRATIDTARRSLRHHFPDRLGHCQGCQMQGVTAEWPCYQAEVAKAVLAVAMAVNETI